MSEEIIQEGFTKKGIELGIFEYFPLKNTTLNQYKKFKIVPDKEYGDYSTRRPDGLLINRSKINDIRVIVAVEYKQPKDFRTEKQKTLAVQQCNDLCQVLDAKIGVITDGNTYVWINPAQGSKDNVYLDRTSNFERSYSYIKNEDKKYLSEPFLLQKNLEQDADKLDLYTKDTLFLIERILSSIGKENSELKSNEQVDPISLAKAVWQDIYVSTGKSPTKCLYNVVELFIFKFLSDLEVLKPHMNFNYIYKISQGENGAKEALKLYAEITRKEIKSLFPSSDDKTTILNGTIFVDKNEKAVESQANLFKNSLKKYHEFGSLRNVKKEFKTKLFETFLKQSSDKNRLGQFFTPRKIVKTIVDMSDVDKLTPGSRVADPFCGVGGFILESIQKPSIKSEFLPDKEGRINPSVVFQGFDKGNDDDDERVIILAKANMLIYLSEIIEKYPSLTGEFSKVINETFHFLSDSNLGTLAKIIENEENKYDLILTNPPYITSGTSSLKNEIESEGLSPYYSANGKGVDSLCLEWIIRSLKKNGKAFVILPDGMFLTQQNRELKKMIRQNCFINCFISLPVKTFFNTPQKTLILGITKKPDVKEEQTFPVFSYLVSDIGETLDIYRFENEGLSDLERSKDLFNIYKGSPENFPETEISDPRCKIVKIDYFDFSNPWNIDRLWSKDEKVSLGIEEGDQVIDIEGFEAKLEVLLKSVQGYKILVEEIKNEI